MKKKNRRREGGREWGREVWEKGIDDHPMKSLLHHHYRCHRYLYQSAVTRDRLCTHPDCLLQVAVVAVVVVAFLPLLLLLLLVWLVAVVVGVDVVVVHVDVVHVS